MIVLILAAVIIFVAAVMVLINGYDDFCYKVENITKTLTNPKVRVVTEVVAQFLYGAAIAYIACMLYKWVITFNNNFL